MTVILTLKKKANYIANWIKISFCWVKNQILKRKPHLCRSRLRSLLFFFEHLIFFKIIENFYPQNKTYEL